MSNIKEKANLIVGAVASGDAEKVAALAHEIGGVAAGKLDEAQGLKAGGGENPLDKWFAPQSWEEMIDDFSRQGDGLRTAWKVRFNGGEPYDIVIPSGAITVFSAPTGHGKTKLLANVTLQYLKAFEGTGRQVWHIHYEMSKGDTIGGLINVKANTRVADINADYIRTFLKGGESTSIPLLTAQDYIKTKYTNGELRVISTSPTIEEIVAAAQEGARRGVLGALVIDYVQKIGAQKKGIVSAKDRISYVMGELDKLAQGTGVAIATASQFNRLAEGPASMQMQQNADASEIEHTASLVVGLWSSYIPPRDGILPKEIGRFDVDPEGIGFMYMRVFKNRNGLSNSWGVQRYDANTGAIW